MLKSQFNSPVHVGKDMHQHFALWAYRGAYNLDISCGLHTGLSFCLVSTSKSSCDKKAWSPSVIVMVPQRTVQRWLRSVICVKLEDQDNCLFKKCFKCCFLDEKGLHINTSKSHKNGRYIQSIADFTMHLQNNSNSNYKPSERSCCRAYVPWKHFWKICRWLLQFKHVWMVLIFVVIS